MSAKRSNMISRPGSPCSGASIPWRTPSSTWPQRPQCHPGKAFGPGHTKDGVTVAKEIELEDKSKNMGAQMVPGSGLQNL